MTQNHTSSSTAGGVRLDLYGLGKRYGQREVLRQAQLHIAPGEFVAIVGRSGCGKSTLLRLVAGLESATSGEVHLDGQPLQGLSSSTRIMFQDARLLPWKRVLDNVALLVTHDVQEAVALADRVVLIEDGHIALDQRIDLPRPRQHNAAFAALEQRILDRVLQKPAAQAPTSDGAWPGVPAHGLRWAI